MPIHAVLTGDLIASTAAPRERIESAMAALAAAAQEPWLPDLRFTRFRGDGWQMLLPRPGLALRLALWLTAGLAARQVGLTTRISIGFGGVDHAGGADLSDAAGVAFLRSGRGLDHMARGRRWAVSGGSGLPGWTCGYFDLAEWQSARWTAGQAAVVAEWLDPAPLRQEDRAERLGLTRQAWKSRFDGAGIASWGAALAAFEAWDGAGVRDD